ncbi:MAG: hypothetical protein ACSW8I_04615, partial [bacterium]
AMALPDEWAGLEVHFYAYVEDWKHQTSETIYLEGRSEHPEGELSTLKRENIVAKNGAPRRGSEHLEKRKKCSEEVRSENQYSPAGATDMQLAGEPPTLQPAGGGAKPTLPT